MSALQDAMTVLRERANAASSWEGVWRIHPERLGRVIEIKGDGWDDAIVASCIDYGGNENGTEKAAYIATMRPSIAHGLADLLGAVDHHIASHECEAVCESDGCDIRKAAEKLTKRVLGSVR